MECCSFKDTHTHKHAYTCMQVYTQEYTHTTVRMSSHLVGAPPRGELAEAEEHGVGDVYLAFDALVLQWVCASREFESECLCRHCSACVRSLPSCLCAAVSVCAAS